MRTNHISKTTQSHPQFNYFQSCWNHISCITHPFFHLLWMIHVKQAHSKFISGAPSATYWRAPLHHKCGLFKTKRNPTLSLQAGNSTPLTQYANRETSEQRCIHLNHALEGWQAATTEPRCVFALNCQMYLQQINEKMSPLLCC